MTKGFFITGTDTEVGKTYVSTWMMRAIAERGLDVAGFKPVASGGCLEAGVLKNDDALQLLAASTKQAPYEVVNPYCFEAAIAPHIAAQRAGQVIELAKIHSCYQALEKDVDVVVVEGAGGWLTPLASGQSFDAIAKELNLGVILVVGLKLGCINHALLTQISIQQSGCQLVGWVANGVDANYGEVAETVQLLQKEIKAPCLAVLEHQENINGAAKMKACEEDALFNTLQ